MRYVLAIKSPLYGKQGSFFAYQFAQSLISKHHKITQIFFFQDGVYNGNNFSYPANDEFNLLKHWQQLGKEFSIPLHLCIAASQRRGIVNHLTAFTSEQSNLAEGFVLAGLGEFIKSTLEADRVITL